MQQNPKWEEWHNLHGINKALSSMTYMLLPYVLPDTYSLNSMFLTHTLWTLTLAELSLLPSWPLANQGSLYRRCDWARGWPSAETHCGEGSAGLCTKSSDWMHACTHTHTEHTRVWLCDKLEAVNWPLWLRWLTVQSPLSWVCGGPSSFENYRESLLYASTQAAARARAPGMGSQVELCLPSSSVSAGVVSPLPVPTR